MISEGVTAAVTPSNFTSVSVNRKDESGNLVCYSPASPPLEYILGILDITVSVTTECRLPIGAGFGLGSSTACHPYCGQPVQQPRADPARYRCACPRGRGCPPDGSWRCCSLPGRRKSGAERAGHRWCNNPASICLNHSMPFRSDRSQLLCARLAGTDGARYRRIPTPRTGKPGDFFKISRRFAEKSGLLTTEAEAVIRRCADNNVPATMTMLGNGVFACGQKDATSFQHSGKYIHSPLRKTEHGLSGPGNDPDQSSPLPFAGHPRSSRKECQKWYRFF